MAVLVTHLHRLFTPTLTLPLEGEGENSWEREKAGYFHSASVGQTLELPRAAPWMPSTRMSAVASRNLMK